MKLNPEQEMAASHIDGPCLVTACPGSGKTRTIVERTVRLMDAGVPPYRICSITFTNKASAEMKTRIEKRAGSVAKQLWVSTFHRLCSTILRLYGKPLGYGEYMTIMDEDEQIDLLGQIARRMEYEFTKPQLKTIVWHLNDHRENLETLEDLYERYDKIEPRYFDVAEKYLTTLPLANRIDFSGLLSETHKLLTSHQPVTDALQARWSHFQVDEVQDTNLAQFKIIEMIASKSKNVFVVGDLDQSIYGWRGARAENINDFRKVYPGTKIISLGKNYRSTPQIVKVADKLIRHNDDRIAAPFETDNPDGPPVTCRMYADDREEASTVARTIHHLVASGKFRYSDIAVFYRMNAMSRAIEMALIQQATPHTLIGSFSFFDRREVKDSISMLKFLVNPRDGVSFHRVANKPKRALGDVTVGKIENVAVENDCSIIEALDRMTFKSDSVNEGLGEIRKAFCFDWKGKPIGECLDHILKALRYDEFLKDDPDTYADRSQNLEELVRDAARYSEENNADIAGYLEQITLLSSSDKSADGNAVSLMSLHASKGLEFPAVFMLGCEQDILPHKRAVQERPDGLAEERRLCYVGMTRAEKILVVSHCQRRQDGGFARQGRVSYRRSAPSQFLFESGLLKRDEMRQEKLTERNHY
jgi:DNA helicase-2/ATP-dependent DNA helicase PcrA